MTNETQTQKTNSIWKKYLAAAILGSAITFAGIGIYNHLNNPQRIKKSEVERKAEEIYETLKDCGFLKYNLNGKDITLTLSPWSGGRYGGFIGYSINLDNGEEVIFGSDIIGSCDKGGHARTLRAIEIHVPDGRREFKVKDIPEKDEFQAKYDNLIEQVYQEKIKHDKEAKSLLDKIR
jgi:hypothetical protein